MLLRQFIRDEARLLTFRSPGPGMREHAGAYLAFGLALTWLAGVGRYWDAADARVWQHLGFGSLAYVFMLAFVLWLLVAPLGSLGPENWSYRKVLLFVALTSPPALLYAIPVERVLDPATAISVNLGFLAVVAAWRVALLVVFLHRAARLGGMAIVVATLLPLALIVDGLALAGLGNLVFQAMAGVRDPVLADGGTAPLVVSGLTALSAVLTPVLLAAYVALLRKARIARAAPHATAA